MHLSVVVLPIHLCPALRAFLIGEATDCQPLHHGHVALQSTCAGLFDFAVDIENRLAWNIERVTALNQLVLL